MTNPRTFLPFAAAAASAAVVGLGVGGFAKLPDAARFAGARDGYAQAGVAEDPGMARYRLVNGPGPYAPPPYARPVRAEQARGSPEADALWREADLEFDRIEAEARAFREADRRWRAEREAALQADQADSAPDEARRWSSFDVRVSDERAPAYAPREPYEPRRFEGRYAAAADDRADERFGYEAYRRADERRYAPRMERDPDGYAGRWGDRRDPRDYAETGGD